jgi:hypothetical protein
VLETATGAVRMNESTGKSILSLLAGYRDVMKIIAESRGSLFSLAIAARVMAIQRTIIMPAAAPFGLIIGIAARPHLIVGLPELDPVRDYIYFLIYYF